MHNIRPNPNRFLMEWVLDKVLLWPRAMIACVLAWAPLAIVVVVIVQDSEPALWLRILTITAGLLLPGIAVGFVAGEAQYRLMRDHLDWQPLHWIRNSTIGGALGGGVALLSTAWTDSSITEQLLFAMPLFALFLSAAQWFSLRRVTHSAWLWILGNLVGGIVFTGLFLINHPGPFNPLGSFGTLFMWLLAVSAQALITGIVLLWLYDRPVLEWDNDDDERELAPIYVEVYTDDHRRR
jgi:hypothetical protein